MATLKAFNHDPDYAGVERVGTASPYMMHDYMIAPRICELYDIHANRTETIDLAGDHPDRVRRMAETWFASAEEMRLEGNLPPRGARSFCRWPGMAGGVGTGIRRVRRSRIDANIGLWTEP